MKMAKFFSYKIQGRLVSFCFFVKLVNEIRKAYRPSFSMLH